VLLTENFLIKKIKEKFLVSTTKFLDRSEGFCGLADCGKQKNAEVRNKKFVF
jgi:hypothetical protein